MVRRYQYGTGPGVDYGRLEVLAAADLTDDYAPGPTFHVEVLGACTVQLRYADADADVTLTFGAADTGVLGLGGKPVAVNVIRSESAATELGSSNLRIGFP